jgi:hypothetical protein
MSVIHQVFDIFAFTVALLELVHLHVEGKIAGRRWIVPTLIGLLITMGAVVAYDSIDHHSSVTNAQGRIIGILQTDPRSLDELSHGLPSWDLPLVPEALEGLIRSGHVTFDDVKLGQLDGSIQHEVRLYRIDLNHIALKENTR